VVENLALDAPSTKAIAAMLEATGAGTSSLIVTGEADRVVLKSARNIDGADTVLPADTLNVADVLAHKHAGDDGGRRPPGEALWGGDRVGREAASGIHRCGLGR
jgi:hypothetical protein